MDAMMGGMARHGGGMAGMMQHMMCGFTEHLDGRLAYLKAELKLTDRTDLRLEQFRRRLARRGPEGQRQMRGDRQPPGSTPNRPSCRSCR